MHMAGLPASSPKAATSPSGCARRDHQRLLLNELSPRVRNTLATVQSIASQTLRNAGSTVAAREAMESRLFALSPRPRRADPRELGRRLDRRSSAGHVAVPVDGPGAASTATARPSVSRPMWPSPSRWRCRNCDQCRQVRLVERDGRSRHLMAGGPDAGGAALLLRWEEQGGPPVSRRRAVGSARGSSSAPRPRVILSGEARIAFAPAGVICTVDAPSGPPRARAKQAP